MWLAIAAGRRAAVAAMKMRSITYLGRRESRYGRARSIHLS
jgi:hypothetical protein